MHATLVLADQMYHALHGNWNAVPAVQSPIVASSAVRDSVAGGASVELAPGMPGYLEKQGIFKHSSGDVGGSTGCSDASRLRIVYLLNMTDRTLRVFWGDEVDNGPALPDYLTSAGAAAAARPLRTRALYTNVRFLYAQGLHSISLVFLIEFSLFFSQFLSAARRTLLVSLVCELLSRCFDARCLRPYRFSGTSPSTISA